VNDNSQVPCLSVLTEDISKSRGEELFRPVLKDYPKNGRSFVSNWFDKYDWMEYSQKKMLYFVMVVDTFPWL